MVELKFKKLNDKAELPYYVHEGDSGMDVRSAEDVVILGHSYAKIKTGLACEIPEGYEIQVRPRSGLAARNGVQASWGTVDSCYRGEIGVTLMNHDDSPFHVCVGDRIAQLVVSPVIRAKISETDELGSTSRGADGFGSSGVK